jgi:hypothetical protein
LEKRSSNYRDVASLEQNTFTTVIIGLLCGFLCGDQNGLRRVSQAPYSSRFYRPKTAQKNPYITLNSNPYQSASTSLKKIGKNKKRNNRIIYIRHTKTVYSKTR